MCGVPAFCSVTHTRVAQYSKCMCGLRSDQRYSLRYTLYRARDLNWFLIMGSSSVCYPCPSARTPWYCCALCFQCVDSVMSNESFCSAVVRINVHKCNQQVTAAPNQSLVSCSTMHFAESVPTTVNSNMCIINQ